MPTPEPGEPEPTEPAPTPAPEECETPEPTPTPTPTEKPDLSPTGGDMALPLGALGVTLLIGGAAVYMIRRRVQQ